MSPGAALGRCRLSWEVLCTAPTGTETWPKCPQRCSGWGLCSAGDHVLEPCLALAEQVVLARLPLQALCPAARLQPCSPADGRVNLLPLSISARCSGGEMLQGWYPLPSPPCPLPGGVVALVIPGTDPKKRWCVLLSFGDKDISPHGSQQCQCQRQGSPGPLPWGHCSPRLLPSLKHLHAAQAGEPGRVSGAWQ